MVTVFSMFFDGGLASFLAAPQNMYDASAIWPMSWPKLRTSGVGLNAYSAGGISSAAPTMNFLTRS